MTTKSRPAIKRAASPTSSPQSLSQAAQKAILSKARQQVEIDVIHFLQGVDGGNFSETERNPNSADLLPFFEKYAWSVMEAQYRDRIFLAPSVSKAQTLIEKAIDLITDYICKKGVAEEGKIVSGGVWPLTVWRACEAVDFYGVEDKNGEVKYNWSTFARPRRGQLRARLRVKTRKLVTEFWEQKADTKSSSDSVSYPERARWLKKEMYKRGIDAPALAGKSRLTPKTVQKILDGEGVRNSTLQQLANGLSENEDKVLVSDIPQM
jgi:hypothetical protein